MVRSAALLSARSAMPIVIATCRHMPGAVTSDVSAWAVSQGGRCVLANIGHALARCLASVPHAVCARLVSGASLPLPPGFVACAALQLHKLMTLISHRMGNGGVNLLPPAGGRQCVNLRCGSSYSLPWGCQRAAHPQQGSWQCHQRLTAGGRCSWFLAKAPLLWVLRLCSLAGAGGTHCARPPCRRLDGPPGHSSLAYP